MGDVLDRFVLPAAADGLVVEAGEELAGAFRDLAVVVVGGLPDCRYRSLALTALEEALSWALRGVWSGGAP